jgi:hypothetical protein
MRDLTTTDLVFYHLYLCSLATVNQVIGAIKRYNLARRVAVKCRYG